jgi:hypothetical protein
VIDPVEDGRHGALRSDPGHPVSARVISTDDASDDRTAHVGRAEVIEITPEDDGPQVTTNEFGRRIQH